MASPSVKFTNHVNRLGGLYIGPQTEKNAFTKIIAKMISDEECELGMFLDKTPRPAEEIAEKAGIPPEKAEEMLWHMCNRGAIFCHFVKGKRYYRLVPFIPGIYEFIMTGKGAADEELSKLFLLAVDQLGGIFKMVSPQEGGLMKVTPVMREIKAQQKILSYEDVMGFIERGHKFSCADCACRTAMKILGKGCEHPINDICLQLDDTAEFYIQTGRGKELTKEQAIGVLDRAEKAGLVHTVFATEGINNTSFICNCCGCSCSGLRITKQYGGNAFSASNFRARINVEKCVACGSCVDICPMNAIQMGSKLCDNPESQIAKHKLPTESPWGKKDWNPDYRDRVIVTEKGTSPCKTKCPAHISVQGYIQKAAEGNYREALEVIKHDNPLPAVCGKICPHSCESECSRATVDEPLAIDDIKMFIANRELEEGFRYIPEVISHYEDKKAAVIGSGPAGISCAYYLAAEGFSVTVFEKQKQPGGMLTLGIPSFRLEKDLVLGEIDVLKQMGVQFRMGVEVGKDVTIADLRKEGFGAFYLGVGAQKGASLHLENESAENVSNGVDFLRRVNLGNAPELKGNVVVIGGGNVAIDVARSAVRCGAGSVDMYCLESAVEMPAAIDEQEEAKEEGIVIHNGWGPKELVTENGLVTSVTFKKCLSVKDASGRFHPAYDEAQTIPVAASTVLLAIGQQIDWGRLLDGESVSVDPRGRVIVQEISYQSSQPDIFAGGDAVTGPKFAIDAIAAGKQGAVSIGRYLLGTNLTLCRERNFKALDKNEIDVNDYDHSPRQKTGAVDPEKARKTFHDLRTELTEEQIRKETKRCLHCGLSIVDETKCIGCGVCVVQCKFDAIHLERISDSDPAETFGDFYKRALKYAVKRAGHVTANSVKNAFAAKD